MKKTRKDAPDLLHLLINNKRMKKNSRALARPRAQARRAFDLKRFALSKKITQNPGTILQHAPPLAKLIPYNYIAVI